MAATPSVKITKSMAWKGGTRQFSNRYHFNGGVPADDAAWHALMDAVVDAEKAIYQPTVTIELATGYVAGSDVGVAVKSYTTEGTGDFVGAVYTPGEVAALVRYETTARTSKNHPIYLFNYYHEAFVGLGVLNKDKLNPAQKTAMETYATAWLTGFSDGTNTLVRSGPNGATATARIVEEYVTHRDFPYLSSV